MKKLLVLILLLLNFSIGLAQTPKNEKPNIVFFLIDDMGWSDFGNRNIKFKSPNIDKLIQESIDFQQAYVPSPSSSASRVALLTGQHPAALKMYRNVSDSDEAFNTSVSDSLGMPSRNWLPKETITYADALKELGYYNAFVGKWNLGNEKHHPIHYGFDEQLSVSNIETPQSYYPPYFKESKVKSKKNKPYLTDKITEDAVSFIDTYPKNKPFMLSIWHYGLHRPHQGKKEHVAYFESKGMTSEKANYAAMVKSVDESIGLVQEALKRKNLSDDTIIILLSDQGGEFKNKMYNGTKNTNALYEGGTRIPFFLKWPGVTKPSINKNIVQTTDLFPTLIEIAGGDPTKHKNLAGHSLASILHGKENHKEREAIFGYHADAEQYLCVRKGEWKALAYRSGKTELFNIRFDFRESADLSPKMPLLMGFLTDEMVYFEQRIGIYEQSALKDRMLLITWFRKQRFKELVFTEEQKIKMTMLDKQVAIHLRDLRKNHDIYPEIMHRWDAAYDPMNRKGLKGLVSLYAGLKKANFSKTQEEGFTKIYHRKVKYRKESDAILTEEQKAQLRNK